MIKIWNWCHEPKVARWPSSRPKSACSGLGQTWHVGWPQWPSGHPHSSPTAAGLAHGDAAPSALQCGMHKLGVAHGMANGERAMVHTVVRLHEATHCGAVHPSGMIPGPKSHRRSTVTWRAGLIGVQWRSDEGGRRGGWGGLQWRSTGFGGIRLAPWCKNRDEKWVDVVAH
jgi:hypothetical protein